VLLALSFPKFGHFACGWIALAPLLVALARPVGTRKAFVLGLVTAGVYLGGTLYWITLVMARYGGLPMALAVVLNAALIAYFALFPALFALVMHRALMIFGARALAAAPLVWVANEVGRTHVMSGFPWVLLGYSQAEVLPIAQLASIVGVFGVSAVVASGSAAVAYFFVADQHRWRPVVWVALAVFVAGTWGSRRESAAAWTRAGEPIRVGLVQGNVRQDQKWDPSNAAFIFQNYLDMTKQAIGRGAELVLWPESSTPFRFEEKADRDTDRLRAIARQARVPILIGSDEIEHGLPIRYYNSAFLVGDDGATGGVYRKIHLVPWGEYVPFRRILFFAAPLVEAVSDFSPGRDPSVLPVRGHKISTAICYEIVYPNLVRQFVLAGSELLTTITNDAWFGTTSAPYQHFAQASMRAIEEGRYLVRAANTGISGIVDPYGHVIDRSTLNEPVVMVGEARFLQVTTIYTRIGDSFAYATVVATAALVWASRRRRWRGV
jgi:apolipoprotein N-acyltransferase